jgi:hypothetical protein
MNPVLDAESVMDLSSYRLSKLRPQDKSVNYLDHPYRFVAFGIFAVLNMLCGTFMLAFLPLKELISLVG